VGSPKWHASPEFREHVFECEEPSCVRDVRDSAPLLRSLVRSLPSGARRADGHSRGSSPGGPGRFTTWTDARARVGICMQELTTTGSLARLHVFQPHNNVYYAPRPVCV